MSNDTLDRIIVALSLFGIAFAACTAVWWPL